jgi:hypothetical protein
MIRRSLPSTALKRENSPLNPLKWLRPRTIGRRSSRFRAQPQKQCTLAKRGRPAPSGSTTSFFIDPPPALSSYQRGNGAGVAGLIRQAPGPAIDRPLASTINIVACRSKPQCQNHAIASVEESGWPLRKDTTVKTLFLTTAAFAALMIAAPVGQADAGTGMCYARDMNGHVRGHDCAPDEVGDLCQHDFESGEYNRSKKAYTQWLKECGTFDTHHAMRPAPSFSMPACLKAARRIYGPLEAQAACNDMRAGV